MSKAEQKALKKAETYAIADELLASVSIALDAPLEAG